MPVVSYITCKFPTIQDQHFSPNCGCCCCCLCLFFLFCFLIFPVSSPQSRISTPLLIVVVVVYVCFIFVLFSYITCMFPTIQDQHSSPHCGPSGRTTAPRSPGSFPLPGQIFLELFWQFSQYSLNFISTLCRYFLTPLFWPL